MMKLYSPRLATLTGVLVAAMLAANHKHAHAEPTQFSVERFRISNDRLGLLDVESGNLPRKLSWELGVWMGVADDPLVLRAGDDQTEGLVTRRIGGELGGSISLTNWLGLALRAPLIASQSGQVNSVSMQSLDSFGLGNLRVAVKIRLLRGLSLIPAASFPTASSKDYFGQDSISWEPELAASKSFGKVRLAANAGVKLREEVMLADLKVGNEAFLRGGVGFGVTKKVELGVTAAAGTALSDFFTKRNTNALEVLGGVQAKLGSHAMLYAAGGAGLRRGYGTPDWRALAGLRFWIGDDESKSIKEIIDNDPDKDSILGSDDRCPKEAETINQFEDTDGCPDTFVADTDGDGLMDDKDRCINEPEDQDAFDDSDGCPDPDNDGDTVLDVADACINVVGAVANRGCPDPDRDGDTVVDRLDNCPDEPGEVANAGCKKKQLVSITNDKLDILDKVYFQTNKAIILKQSYALLDNVADVIKSHPEIGKVRVEGHTDSRGNDGSNLKLSDRRAKSVVTYLIGKGVPADRLEGVGFGEERPIADNTSNDGRSANRRVEFVITGDGTKVQNQNSGPSDATKDK